MNKLQPKQSGILSISPSSRGFGFAVFTEQGKLVNWGVKRASGDKNTQSLAKVKEKIAQYQPGVIVLEDCSTKEPRRAPRIQKLSKQIIALAAKNKIQTTVFSRSQVREVFFADGVGTKHGVAEIIANQFPELAFQLPPKRKLWIPEDPRMDIFDAVALVQAFRQQKLK